MTADTTFVLLLRANIGVGELARVCRAFSDSMFLPWISMTMDVLDDQVGIAGRTEVHHARMLEAGTKKGHLSTFAAFCCALGEVHAPAALLCTAYERTMAAKYLPCYPRTVIMDAFSPMCVAVPLAHARKIMLPSIAAFVAPGDPLNMAVCESLGVRFASDDCAGEGAFRETREDYPDGTHVTHMMPIPGPAHASAETRNDPAPAAPTTPAVRDDHVVPPADQRLAVRDNNVVPPAGQRPAPRIRYFDLPANRAFCYNAAQEEREWNKTLSRAYGFPDDPVVMRLTALHDACALAAYRASIPAEGFSPTSTATRFMQMRRDIERALCVFYEAYEVKE